MKARLPLLAALCVALFPQTGLAQAWVSNPDFSEGIGIRAGNLEIHPGVGAEFGYDSNLFRASEREGVVDVMKLRVTPSVTLSTLGSERRHASTPPKISFSAGAHASYYELFPLDSANSEVSKRRNLGLGADARLDIFPAGKFGVDLESAYARVIETEGRTDDLTGEGFNRQVLRGGGGVTWRPGGRLFEWRASYLGSYRFFENDAYASFDNVQHELKMRGRWKFLPRSALLFESAYTLIRYTHDDTAQTDGDVVRTRIGFHGLVTYHLALMGLVGWASSFYEAGRDTIVPRQHDSIIANAEVRWFIQPQPNLEQATIASGLSSLALGYTRTFNNSYYGSFYQQDRGYVVFNMFLVGALVGGLELGVSRVAFPEVELAGRPPRSAFDQLRLDGQAFAEYRFTDTLAANATIQYAQVNSPIVNNEDLEYRRWQAYLGVRWFL